jgi:hypothetical protein
MNNRDNMINNRRTDIPEIPPVNIQKYVYMKAASHNG